MVRRTGRGLYVLGTLVAAMIVGWIALGNSLVFAQGTAAISGVVRDASGAVIPETAITIRQTETGLTRTAVTNPDGGYFVPSLPVGPYELTAEKAGFRQQVRMGITLSVGQQAVVNWVLEVGQVQQTVEVTGEAPIVNTTLQSTSGLVSQEQVQDLPLNGRSFDNLLTINVSTTNPSSNINNGAWTAYSIAGKRMETNRYLMNGLDWIGINGTGQFITPLGVSRQLLGVEAVREYNVLQHTYGAEYGKRAGGQISIVTNSGTNQLHGNVFEYLRNSALDARNYFDQTDSTPPFKRNQFGGALGGPLKKDKAFLFGTYEGYRQRLAYSADTLVPDAQARQGLLPCYLATPTACGSNPGQYVTVPNLKPGMLPYLNYFWPTPNQPIFDASGRPTGTAHAFSNPASRFREDFALARFDYSLSSNDSLWANYNFDHGTDGRPPADPVFITVDRTRTQGLGFQETHIFSPSLLNTFTYGFSRAYSISQSRPVVPIPASLFFVEGTSAGSITVGGAAQTNVQGTLAAPNGNMPYRGRRWTQTWSDDVHFVKGNHSLSAGVWFYRLEEDLIGGAQRTAGTVSYSTLLNMLQDIPATFQLTPSSNPGDYGSTEAAWYIQDEWKLKPNLTLRLGLRDEMTTGWYAKSGFCSNYVFGQNGVYQTDTIIGHSCLLENNALALWQPRVGVAWDPGGKGTWAVRAGFGIHNDLQDNLGHRVQANPPFNSVVTLPSGPGNGILGQIPIPRDVRIPPSCHNAPTETGCTIFQPGGLDPTMRTPTIQNWSLTVERGLTRDLMLSLGYVGMQSYHTSLTMNVNEPVPQVCANPAGCLSGGVLAAAQRTTVPQGTTYIPPGLRPNPNLGATQAWFYLGTSSYHALNVSLTKRSRGGLTFKTNYTWSKVLDLHSAILSTFAINEPATILNPYNLKLNKGIATYSLAHQFNANFTYPLPFGRGHRFGGGATGLLDRLIGGWQWNGIVNAQSGFPFTPTVGSNISGNGDTNVPDLPNRNPNFHGKVVTGVDSFKKTGRYFDPNAFSLPLAGTFGNSPRGGFFGPGLFTLDTSFFKRININEKWALQFRAEAFNLLNHPNFGTPNPVVFSGTGYGPSTGVITATNGTSRQIQFALKLQF